MFWLFLEFPNHGFYFVGRLCDIFDSISTLRFHRLNMPQKKSPGFASQRQLFSHKQTLRLTYELRQNITGMISIQNWFILGCKIKLHPHRKLFRHCLPRNFPRWWTQSWATSFILCTVWISSPAGWYALPWIKKQPKRLEMAFPREMSANFTWLSLGDGRKEKFSVFLSQ